MHDHDDHDHVHDQQHPALQQDHDAGPMGAYEVLEEAVRSLLIEKGILTAQEIAAAVDLMDSRTPALGAKVVAVRFAVSFFFPFLAGWLCEMLWEKLRV